MKKALDNFILPCLAFGLLWFSPIGVMMLVLSMQYTTCKGIEYGEGKLWIDLLCMPIVHVLCFTVVWVLGKGWEA